MSSPGFTGGGTSDFFAGAGGLSGRSVAATVTTMNNPITASANKNNLLHNSHPLYRTQQQLPSIFLDPSSQMAQRQTQGFPGKRTLAEFQNHQNHSHNFNNNQNQVLSNLFLRSVKPRTFQNNSSPLSPMSPMDFSVSPELQNPSSAFQTQRFGMPHLHQLRPQPINLPNGTLPMITNSIIQNPNFPYRNSNLPQVVQNRVQIREPEKKIMENRLQELEKQLLEDNDEEGDAASVITSNEWSEAIQNLISPNPTQKPISLSPSSSTTSSTSSSSVASPASGNSKQTLIDAASALSEGKSEAAVEILARLAQVSNPNGSSDQRFTDCMVSALKSRMNPVENPPVAELFGMEHAESTQLLFEHSLCFRVAFMAANHAILEAALEVKAVNGGNKFCVVDFDIGRGKQYVSLLQMLSERQNGKPVTVKITAVAENGAEERLKTVGEMLRLQAERFRIGFEFKVVTLQLTELTRESLGCEADVPLAVNFAFKLYKMPDESVSTENPRDELLRRVKGLAPLVVTLVEQELNTNTALFKARVAESCSYYGALFDSIESTMARDNSVPDRVKLEEGLSRKIGNSISCEGRDRVERCEVFGKWRARVSMAGFQLKPMSQSVAESIKSLLSKGNRGNPGITVKEENGGICIGWMGRTLTVASAWR